MDASSENRGGEGFRAYLPHAELRPFYLNLYQGGARRLGNDVPGIAVAGLQGGLVTSPLTSTASGQSLEPSAGPRSHMRLPAAAVTDSNAVQALALVLKPAHAPAVHPACCPASSLQVQDDEGMHSSSNPLPVDTDDCCCSHLKQAEAPATALHPPCLPCSLDHISSPNNSAHHHIHTSSCSSCCVLLHGITESYTESSQSAMVRAFSRLALALRSSVGGVGGTLLPGSGVFEIMCALWLRKLARSRCQQSVVEKSDLESNGFDASCNLPIKWELEHNSISNCSSIVNSQDPNPQSNALDFSAPELGCHDEMDSSGCHVHLRVKGRQQERAWQLLNRKLEVDISGFRAEIFEASASVMEDMVAVVLQNLGYTYQQALDCISCCMKVLKEHGWCGVEQSCNGLGIEQKLCARQIMDAQEVLLQASVRVSPQGHLSSMTRLSQHGASISGNLSSSDTAFRSCALQHTPLAPTAGFIADSVKAREAGLHVCSHILELLLRNDAVIVNN
ncbi:hypothetical protein CEUSTIGMA_g13028.t1 [Chlamydomonas eustigma]|uniref:Uncharacterized protein n=1 Tax=Chlamydomonas eustigma TaxID=1157962 RepID=A0A250XRH7_9CHLO|nr:hypothetical protein CEUSTIGMA_g13028.t1 [Chlamydomonas eustigma]|eukprot:GAX85613.1 hypothetical protein CEUSTIGMA_g13028.t1 [Chlamydomonas eustigma]